MRRIKKLQANGVYLIVTKSSRRSSFFENTSQIRLFKNQFQRHLDGICEVLHEFYNPCGYVYIIKTLSEEEIRNRYLRNRTLSSKKSISIGFEDIWRMISEQFRLAGSTFVSLANRRDKSSGSRFKRNYERYLIEDEVEMEHLIQLLKAEKVYLDQKENGFRLEKSRAKSLSATCKKVNMLYRNTSSSSRMISNLIKTGLKLYLEEFSVVKRRYCCPESVLLSGFIE